jgi:hypothetical protein
MAMTTKKEPLPPAPSTDLARLHDERAALIPRLQRARALVNPQQFGEPLGPAPTTLERLEAPDTVARLDAERRRLDISILKAEAAETERKRRRRDALQIEFDREVRQEYAELVAATNGLAEQWVAFAQRNRARDTEVIATTPAGEYSVGRYGPLGFAPLAGDPTLGCQWAQFRDALARDWS